MGDGRAAGSSAIGDGGQAAISLTPDVDGAHVHIFESSQLEGSYVADLLCILFSLCALFSLSKNSNWKLLLALSSHDLGEYNICCPRMLLKEGSVYFGEISRPGARRAGATAGQTQTTWSPPRGSATGCHSHRWASCFGTLIHLTQASHLVEEREDRLHPPCSERKGFPCIRLGKKTFFFNIPDFSEVRPACCKVLSNTWLMSKDHY